MMSSSSKDIEDGDLVVTELTQLTRNNTSSSAEFRANDTVDNSKRLQFEINSSGDSSLLNLLGDFSSFCPDLSCMNSCFSGQAFLSSTMFAFCSVAMVLANKAIPMIVSEEYRTHIPQMTCIWLQCVVALVCVEIAKHFNLVDYPPFEMDTAKKWLPVNLFFTAMITTGFLSIFYCSLPIVTVFKNVTNLFTIMGDIYFFRETISRSTWASVVVMTIGALMTSMHDLEFSFTGYLWMILNLFATSGYILYMRYASSNMKLSKFGMVYYNNLLSTIILLPICIGLGEFKAFSDPVLMTPPFILTNLIAGFLGFYLNFASLWCVSSTSATTYSIIGTLNKIPITLCGFLIFKAKMTTEGIYYICFATLGGFLFAYSKLP